MSRRLPSLALTLAALLALSGCVDTPQGDTSPAPGTEQGGAIAGEPVEQTAPRIGLTLTPGGETGLLPEPEVIEPPDRARQRLNIEQLSEAIRRATNTQGWTQSQGGQQVDSFLVLRASLGLPDWIEITNEDLSPSPLFHKFLDDAARDVCTTTLTAEWGMPASERAFLRYIEPDEDPMADAARLDKQLSYLLLRWHGHGAAAAAPRLVHWRWLVETTHFTTKLPIAAWRAVCVALMTHPDFYSY